MSSSSDLSVFELRRALIALRENGQLEQFLQETFSEQTASAGAMTDGSKRRAAALESDDEGFDLISSVSTKQQPVMKASTGSSMVPTADMTKEKFPESMSQQFPEGISSLDAWGRTICDLPKVASRGLSYHGLIEEAKNRKETADYLTWVMRTHVQSKKADDLRAFLKASQCDPASQKVVVGQILTYPGSTMVRRMK